MEKNRKKQLILLPNYFKIIGIAAIAFDALFLISNIIFDLRSPLYIQLMYVILIVGLFFIGWSKAKQEDELNTMLRFQAISFAFIFAIFYVFINYLGKFIPLSDEFLYSISAYRLIIIMLVAYIITYYMLRQRYK